jgi:cation:H+ antiporter
MIILLIKLLIGIWLLTKGSDWFTKAAALLTELTGLSRLWLGAVLIGLTTNIPELAVSQLASWTGHQSIALANPIGSNVVNTGLILGLCLVLGRGRIEEIWMREHGVPMLFASVLLYFLILWGDITFVSSLILLSAYALYLVGSFARARNNPETSMRLPAQEHPVDLSLRQRRNTGWTAVILLTLIGGTVVLLSSQWVLSSAVEIARTLQISETVIGLSIIAVGTSLPELATALSALKKGHHDTSLGIVLGSNIFNSLAVVGLSGLVSVLPVTTANRLFDMPVMLLILFIPFLKARGTIQPGRITGFVLLSAYCIYTYSLFTVYGSFEP